MNLITGLNTGYRSVVFLRQRGAIPKLLLPPSLPLQDRFRSGITPHICDIPQLNEWVRATYRIFCTSTQGDVNINRRRPGLVCIVIYWFRLVSLTFLDFICWISILARIHDEEAKLKGIMRWRKTNMTKPFVWKLDDDANPYNHPSTAYNIHKSAPVHYANK
jgi:hypothetical protein